MSIERRDRPEAVRRGPWRRAGSCTVWAVLILGSFTLVAVHSACAAFAATGGDRLWTIADIVQISRILGTAVQGSAQVAAFILETPSLADDRDHYQLFEVSPGEGPRLLAQADFMSNLEWRPGTNDWTLRADFGNGVQLYDVTESGRVKPLLIIKPLVLVGGYEGLIKDSAEKPRLTGVLSYEWASNGRYFWYSRVWLCTPAVQERLRHGIVYDDADTLGAQPSDLRRSIEYAGVELHVVDVRTDSDRKVASETKALWIDNSLSATTTWVDSSELQYDLFSDPYGELPVAVWRVNVQTGARRRVGILAGMSMWTSLPSPRGFIVARQTGPRAGIYEVTPADKVIQDLALTNYDNLNLIPRGVQRGGMWTGPGKRIRIFGVSSSNWVAHGLVFVPSTPATDRISSLPDTLNECSFNTLLTWGICNRESVTKAPELDSVYPDTGRINVLAQPNARYREIASLRTVAQHWRNRFGYINTGYVTFPRGYVPGRKYPALLVTHALDATNVFAWPGFQWAFPVQAFAEQGYFVLSVNEPRPRLHGAAPPYMKDAAKSSIRALWFANSINPMASLEAAVESLIASGQVDPRKIGIAGYSAGAEATSFTISHSHAFRAASISDDSWWDAGGYWGGEALDRQAYDNLFGGSPFDSHAYPNYLKYSPSARAGDIACPVLQEFADYSAHNALELNELLLDARIPTELVIYPHEAHILYGPQDRAMAMRRNLDWFNYWLLGQRDSHPADPGEYERWDKMALRWKARKAECRRELTLPAP